MTENNGGEKNDFGGKWPVHSADILWVKIALSRTVSEILKIFHFQRLVNH